MIQIKSAREISLMREAGKIANEARAACARLVSPGVTTRELDAAARRIIEKYGATPSFLGYDGFPASICCSVNDEVIHGIPSNRKLCEGDVVKVDVGAFYMGYHGDCAASFAVGAVHDDAHKLIEVTKQSFYEGLKFALKDGRISGISRAIQAYNESYGYSVVRDFIGHGIGAELHEAPEVPNYFSGTRGARLVPGMTLAIEPMVNQGAWQVTRKPDGWGIVTADGSLSAHYEETILITEQGPELLTVGDYE